MQNNTNKELVLSTFKSNIKSFLNQEFPLGTFEGNEFRIGDYQGSKGRKISIVCEGSAAGVWYNHETNESGDILELLALQAGKSTKGAEFIEIIEQLAAKLGIQSEPEQPEEERAHIKKRFIHTYRDSDGEGLYQVVRCEYSDDKKTCRPFNLRTMEYEAPDQRCLYNIPGIIDSEGPAIFVEGEKCADHLIERNLTATTLSGGSNAKLDDIDWSYLKDREVIIWPDNDDAGRKYGQRLLEKLQEVTNSVRLLKVDHLPPKYDCADYKDLTGPQFLEMINNFEDEEEEDDGFALPLSKALALNRPLPEAIIKNPEGRCLLEQGGMCLLIGASKTNKTSLAMAMAAKFINGEPVADYFYPGKESVSTFVLQYETEIGRMAGTIDGMIEPEVEQAVKDKIFITDPKLSIPVRLNYEKELDYLVSKIKKCYPGSYPDLLIIDTFRACQEGIKENDNDEINAFLNNYMRVMTKHFPLMSTIFIHHTAKNDRSVATDRTMGIQAVGAGAFSTKAYLEISLANIDKEEDTSIRRAFIKSRGSDSQTIDLKFIFDDKGLTGITRRGRVIEAETEKERSDIEAISFVKQILSKNFEPDELLIRERILEKLQAKQFPTIKSRDAAKKFIKALAIRGTIAGFSLYGDKDRYFCCSGTRLYNAATGEYDFVLPEEKIDESGQWVQIPEEERETYWDEVE